MDALLISLSGLLPFAEHFAAAIIFLLLFKGLYVLVTPYREWHLIREEKNSAAATAFGGAIVGFAIALGSAASNSVSLLDFIIWGVVALLAQLVAFALVRFIFLPGVSGDIEANKLSAGLIVAATSVAVGILNAACMTY
ncbi:MAG: DUF350 domain-containing protein [Oceanospirillaceae bacterium]|nr:DUF350 domain-containing protein [Oceanospirillaceae bacterium]MCP5335968.1 DUF350 domain-containing protein [Oceanospirillaceae bacterium]MCP5350913.1 DUF350 domain-containing protein [Oceanospirillaceae bacterium]